MLRLAANSALIPSLRSGQSEFGRVGWPVSNEYALTFMVNVAGVRSAHPRVSSGDGGK